MYKATFDIVSDAANDESLANSQLLMEISEKTFSFVFYNRQQQRVKGFRQYNLDFIPGKTTFETLQDILAGDELLQSGSKESYVVYKYTDSSLLPEKHFSIELNKPVTELVYGNARKGLVLSEKVNGWNLYNVYRIPREVHSLLQKKFAAGKYWHYYTLLLSNAGNDVANGSNLVKIIIASDQFTLAFFKDEQLQLLQTYTYQTPEDVSYHLLSLCQKFEVNPEELILNISGLIDEQSNLYQELIKYFNRLYWEVLPDAVEMEDAFTQFPAHYFSPLLKMALCVS